MFIYHSLSFLSTFDKHLDSLQFFYTIPANAALNTFLGEHVELLVCVHPTLVDVAKQFSKVVAPIYFPISSAEELCCQIIPLYPRYIG